MSAPLPRPFPLVAVLVAWGAFAGWCVWGFAPCVDLAAHGAQMETLANLLRGVPDVRQVYEVHVPIGYGLTFWLFLPITLLFNGATAVRLALWVTLMLYPLSHLALLRAFRRPDASVLFGLPLAFNISYWYGLVPGLFAQPLLFFSIAAFARALESDKPGRWIFWMNLAATAVLLSHLLAFVALAVALAAWTLVRQPRGPTARVLLQGLALPALLSLPKAWSMAQVAVHPGPQPATEYSLASHFNWFFRNYRPEGYLAALAPLLVTAVFVALYLRRRRLEPLGPAVMFAALALLYLVTPKTLSGIFLISVRLPVLAGMLSLLLVGEDALPRWLQTGLGLLCLASLGETAVFHHRFARAVDGLTEMIREPPPSRHGYYPLVGREMLGSRNVYADHLGQWWTATWGGVGHNFFADAEHHPVRFRPGVQTPSDLWAEPAEAVEQFDQLLVYGAQPLPPRLQRWRLLATSHLWRKLENPSAVPRSP